eukprot:CAMPEP_0117672864 /NCGR_PEP_ID=MMETSP0804-20121206/14149_1 /TAXON_ID=1074897 /ORGANISM="Tetraselmis astigmatica, Strain CCMP880" /LENGTH=811 /DNA_ID=CAMNT_0005481529 /DNA_START=139 /DNA_END=2574 /DNA_ORIENTATION=-
MGSFMVVCARPVLLCGQPMLCLALPPFLPPVTGSRRPLGPIPMRCRNRVISASVSTQEAEVDVDEEEIMRMAESLPPEVRGKALKLWEENKRMRSKLAILESVTELPAEQRIRALDLLKENRALRNTTGSLLQTWDSLKDTVAALSFTMESEAVQAAQGYTMAAAVSSQTTGDGGLSLEFDPDWTFWEAGLSCDGTIALITADGALQLALAKAELMAESEVDNILNRYWQAELADQSPAEAPAAVGESEEVAQPVMAIMDASAASGSIAESVEDVAVEFEAEDALEVEEAVFAVVHKPVAEAEVEVVSAAMELQQEASSLPAAVAKASEPKLEVDVAGKADLVDAVKSKPDRRPSNRNNAGVMAAAAGLGAGMLAVAAGMETAAAMEIMATTALIASAGSLLGSDDASRDLQRKGAGAPALFAIATTLQAADNLTKTIDGFLEKEKTKTMAKYAENAAKMMALAEGDRTKETRNEGIETRDIPSQAPSQQAFSVQRRLQFGQSLVMVGNHEELGGWDGEFAQWDANKSLPMQWQEGDNWVAAAKLPVGSVSFVFAIKSKDGSLSWDGQPKRQLEVPSDSGMVFVQFSWDDPKHILVLAGDEAQSCVAAVLKAAGHSSEVPLTDSYVEELVSQQADELIMTPAGSASSTQFEDTQAFALFLDALATDEERTAPHLDSSMDDSQDGDAPSTARVAFCVYKELPFGQRLKVVGSAAGLGNWDISCAPKMKWTDGHLWVAEVPLTAGKHDFKFAVTSSEKEATLYWETQCGGNRQIQVPEGTARILAKGSFGAVEDMEMYVDADVYAQLTAPVLN